jgi:UDP-N-acetyl-D-mannosaminuronate dehydrogenase
LRESPALEITKRLIDLNFQIMASEPNLKDSKIVQLVYYEQAIAKSDILLFWSLINHLKR